MKRLMVATPLLLALAACGGDDTRAGFSPDGEASSEFWFDSLPEMVATSDVVVIGTVSSVTDGITEGTPPEEIQLSRADLVVKEVLYGPADVPSTVTIETLQLVAPEPDWRQSGNTVIAFVKLSTDPDAPGIYYPINEQSVYLLNGKDVTATTDAHDDFSKWVSGLTVDEIRSKIERATKAIANGNVSPQTPAGG
jgi:hypothetical protein